MREIIYVAEDVFWLKLWFSVARYDMKRYDNMRLNWDRESSPNPLRCNKFPANFYRNARNFADAREMKRLLCGECLVSSDAILDVNALLAWRASRYLEIVWITKNCWESIRSLLTFLPSLLNLFLNKNTNQSCDRLSSPALSSDIYIHVCDHQTFGLPSLSLRFFCCVLSIQN